MWLVAPLEANPLLPNKPRRWRDESECENKEQAEATPLGPFFFFCLSGAGHRSFSSVTRLSLAPSHASTLSWRHPNHTTALEWHRSASSDRKAELLPHHSGEREKNKGGESGGWGEKGGGGRGVKTKPGERKWGWADYGEAGFHHVNIHLLTLPQCSITWQINLGSSMAGRRHG